jgi:hypothetical protein
LKALELEQGVAESRTPVAEGGCQCGAVRYALYVAPQNAHACHCRMCQRAVGGAFALLAGAPKADFAWTKGEPAMFASSNLAERGFCRACGTPLSFSYNLPEARFYVTIGSLDDAEQAPILRQYGVESRLSWVKFCEGAPEEATGADPKAADFLAKLESRQG